MEVELSLTPLNLSQKKSALEVSLDVDNDSINALGYNREELLSAIKSGVESACVQGKRVCMTLYLYCKSSYSHTRFICMELALYYQF